jgi:hypothetical protein
MKINSTVEDITRMKGSDVPIGSVVTLGEGTFYLKCRTYGVDDSSFWLLLNSNTECSGQDHAALDMGLVTICDAVLNIVVRI